MAALNNGRTKTNAITGAEETGNNEFKPRFSLALLRDYRGNGEGGGR